MTTSKTTTKATAISKAIAPKPIPFQKVDFSNSCLNAGDYPPPPKGARSVLAYTPAGFTYSLIERTPGGQIEAVLSHGTESAMAQFDQTYTTHSAAHGHQSKGTLTDWIRKTQATLDAKKKAATDKARTLLGVVNDLPNDALDDLREAIAKRLTSAPDYQVPADAHRHQLEGEVTTPTMKDLEPMPYLWGQVAGYSLLLASVPGLHENQKQLGIDAACELESLILEAAQIVNGDQTLNGNDRHGAASAVLYAIATLAAHTISTGTAPTILRADRDKLVTLARNADQEQCDFLKRRAINLRKAQKQEPHVTGVSLVEGDQ